MLVEREVMLFYDGLMGKAKQSMEMAEFMQAFGRRGVVEVES
jgi:hypothetical protein